MLDASGGRPHQQSPGSPPEPYLYASLTATQPDNTLVATASTPGGGVLSVTQGAQTLAATAGVAVYGFLAATQAANPSFLLALTINWRKSRENHPEPSENVAM
jgi:hypothetical protein